MTQLPSLAPTTSMATAAAPSLSTLRTSRKRNPSLSSSSCSSSPTLRFHPPPSSLALHSSSSPPRKPVRLSPAFAAFAAFAASTPSTFHGPCYVVGDNIDTDQIIPAEHLTLVPSNPSEYQQLGALALIGLPPHLYPTPFVAPGSSTTRYPIIVGGANFGCGSSREHAPVALGAAGVRVVLAESYARIFFRNSVATGEVYPVETGVEGLYKECKTGDLVTVDMGESKMLNHTTGKEYPLKPIGDAGPVIHAGGIFAYARNTGMISSDPAVPSS